MPTSNQTLARNTVYVNESPFVFMVGATPVFTFTFLGSGTLTSPTSNLYRGSQDMTSTNLTGSQPSPSGRSCAAKQLVLDKPGDWELYLTITDGSMVRVKAIRIMVRKMGAY